MLKIQYSGIDARWVEVLVKASGSNVNRAIALSELTAAKAELEAGSALANNAQDAVLSAAISSIVSQIAAITSTAPAASYEQIFTAADLSIAGVLPITHGFLNYPSAVYIYDPDGWLVYPDDVKNQTLNTTAVYLESFAPLQLGNWTASLTK